MSGDKNLLAQLNTALDEYNTVKVELDEDVSIYLNLSRDQIEKLSSSQGFEISSKLMQFSLHLQKLENREKARIAWCDSHIHTLCSRKWDDFDKFMPKELKFHKIGDEDEMVGKLLEIQRQSTTRFNELNNLAQIVRYYSNIFFEIGKKR